MVAGVSKRPETGGDPEFRGQSLIKRDGAYPAFAGEVKAPVINSNLKKLLCYSK